MTNIQTPFRVANLNQLPKTWIVENQLARAGFRSDNCLLSVNFVEPSLARQAPHQHPFDQITFVIQGEMMFEMNGSAQKMSPGDMAHIPANVPHTAWSVTDMQLIVLDVFAPVREDYLSLTSHQTEFGPATGK
jgi:mannose-6-phosphate isomerase-like protein (cupin superfamily)